MERKVEELQELIRRQNNWIRSLYRAIENKESALMLAGDLRWIETYNERLSDFAASWK